jgi:hypothetical protein
MATPAQFAQIPDYISTITGYRAWQVDSCGLKSLNHTEWTPGEPLEAVCLKQQFGHDCPAEGCTCGVYAARNANHLQNIGYLAEADVHGEVALWGTVVPHSLGYRAQYAYPKNLIIKKHRLPFQQSHCETFLAGMTAYGVPVSLACAGEEIIPLWDAERGYSAKGIDSVLTDLQKWYQNKVRILAPAVGDRISVSGFGIGCIVAHIINTQHIHFLALNRYYRIAIKDVHYEPKNNRWEVMKQDCYEIGHNFLSGDLIPTHEKR